MVTLTVLPWSIDVCESPAQAHHVEKRTGRGHLLVAHGVVVGVDAIITPANGQKLNWALENHDVRDSREVIEQQVRHGSDVVGVRVGDSTSAETSRVERALAGLGTDQEALGEGAGSSRRRLGGGGLGSGLLLLGRGRFRASGRCRLGGMRGRRSLRVMGGRRNARGGLINRAAAETWNGSDVHDRCSVAGSSSNGGGSGGAGTGSSCRGGAAGPSFAASVGPLLVAANHALVRGERRALLNRGSDRSGDGLRCGMACSKRVMTARIGGMRARKGREREGGEGEGEGDGLREAEHGSRYVKTE